MIYIIWAVIGETSTPVLRKILKAIAPMLVILPEKLCASLMPAMTDKGNKNTQEAGTSGRSPYLSTKA